MQRWFSRVWQASTTPAPPPHAGVALGVALAVLVALSVPAVWHVLRHLVTIAHEAGHAAVATAVGRRVSGIRVHTDTSGLTTSWGRDRGPGLVATLAAGYPAPALLGLGAAWLVGRGYAVGALWLLLVLLVVVLLGVRNLYGLWAVLVAGGALVAVTGWAPVAWQVVVGHLVCWVLLLGAPRAVLELAAQRRRHTGPDTSDAGGLARLTHVPAALWVGLFGLVGIGAAVQGGWWLLG